MTGLRVPDSEDDEGAQAMEQAAPKRKLSRRDFLKWGVAAGTVAGLSSVGVLSALGYLKGPQEAKPAWEVRPGVVDYDLVPPALAGPTPTVLKVAQWFQYWPGSFIDDFVRYMKETYQLNVDVQVSIFTSNEELFTWITLGRQKFDVFFPSNYVVDLMKNGDMIYNLNPDWIPNLQYIDSQFKGIPRGDPFDQRLIDGNWEPVSVPYFWGTTGIGFRKDQIPTADVVDQGLDFFWKDAWTPSNGGPTVNLRKMMRMLEDERDVLGWGFKKAGWEWQVEQGAVPTGLFPPDGPQWTTNETDPQRVAKAGDYLLSARPNLFDYNSTDAATSLVNASAVLTQVWSGDLMYAKRPDQAVQLPIEYVLPKQGSTWWIDCAAVHAESRNLWLAHQFINFTQSVSDQWPENQTLTKWNLYSTANSASYQYIKDNPYANGYNMATDPVLYPNIYDTEGFRRLDMSGDVGLDALIHLYNPTWFDLTSG